MEDAGAGSYRASRFCSFVQPERRAYGHYDGVVWGSAATRS
jgi:hypothetical protein